MHLFYHPKQNMAAVMKNLPPPLSETSQFLFFAEFKLLWAGTKATGRL